MAKLPDEVRNKWQSLLPQIMIRRLPGVHFMKSVNPLSRMAGLELHEAENGLESLCEVDRCSNVAEWHDLEGIWVFHCGGCMEATKKSSQKVSYSFEQDGRWMDYDDGRPTGCSCHTGNPPCSYCTDTNYCEDCEEKTWNDECPRCGEDLVAIDDMPFS